MVVFKYHTAASASAARALLTENDIPSVRVGRRLRDVAVMQKYAKQASCLLRNNGIEYVERVEK